MVGIAVCGGKSTRMGNDKSTLHYHGKPQHDHVYEMLMSFCETAVISCNAGQMQYLQTDYPTMPDLPEYADSGPIAGLLSAFECFPGQDLLFIGCDYPFLTIEDIHFFIGSLSKDSVAAAFYNSEYKYEPLLAFYGASLAARVRSFWDTGERSLQTFLRQHGAAKHVPQSERSMFSADTPEDMRLVQISLPKKLL